MVECRGRRVALDRATGDKVDDFIECNIYLNNYMYKHVHLDKLNCENHKWDTDSWTASENFASMGSL